MGKHWVVYCRVPKKGGRRAGGRVSRSDIRHQSQCCVSVFLVRVVQRKDMGVKYRVWAKTKGGEEGRICSWIYLFLRENEVFLVGGSMSLVNMSDVTCSRLVLQLFLPVIAEDEVCSC